MDKIYLITRSEGSCQSDYRENAVKAFADQTLAEAHVLELKAIDARFNKIGKAAYARFHAEFMPTHKQPEYKSTPMKEPVWNQKNGSKKNADPEVLKEFQAREAAYRAHCHGSGTAHYAAMAEWQTTAIAASHDFLRAEGATEEELVELFSDHGALYFSVREYDYAVDEIPFQG